MKLPARYVLANIVDQFLYWYFPPVRWYMHRTPKRPAGFNEEVDEQRLNSIRFKADRGWWKQFPVHDTRFLVRKLEECGAFKSDN